MNGGILIGKTFNYFGVLNNEAFFVAGCSKLIQTEGELLMKDDMLQFDILRLYKF